MPPLTPMLPDTIVAISTPPGRGGIGVVRLSGPGAVQIASGLVRLRGGGSLADAAHHAHARLAGVLSADAHGDDPASEIDEALVTVFHAPRSYTGEALVEIAAHGSPVVLEAIVRNALAAGASTVEAGSPAAQLAASLAAGLAVRLAAPGEFTQRAFLAGRLDLTQAEAVHDLIAAQTLAQARTAASQLGGALSRRVAPAKEALLQLIALLEAGMDFASGELDDVDIVPATQIAAAIGATHVPLAALAATFRQGQLQRGGAAVALAGPPNAGKSSLFNRLLQRERAIVTPVPGTTRDTVEETLALGGIPLRLVDTAGLREGNLYREGTLYIDGDIGGQIVEPVDEAERLGIVRSREALADADLVLLVHDATLPRSPEELTLAAELAGRPHVIVYNKADLLEAGPPVSERAGETQPVYTSAMTGQGLDELRDAMLRALNAEGASADAGLLNNLRQQQAVTETLAQLDAADAANAAGLPHELLLLDLHAALESLDTLTGTTTTEDILTRIFSTFCIGK